MVDDTSSEFKGNQNSSHSDDTKNEIFDNSKSPTARFFSSPDLNLTELLCDPELMLKKVSSYMSAVKAQSFPKDQDAGKTDRDASTVPRDAPSRLPEAKEKTDDLDVSDQKPNSNLLWNCWATALGLGATAASYFTYRRMQTSSQQQPVVRNDRETPSTSLVFVRTGLLIVTTIQMFLCKKLTIMSFLACLWILTFFIK